MKTERIAVSPTANAILRMNVFRPASIAAKTCVYSVKHQPGASRRWRKFFFISCLFILSHRIWKCTEVEIFAAFQMTAGAAVGNFLSSGVVIFTLVNADNLPAVPSSIGMCLGVILLGKLFSANLMRLLLIRKSLREKKSAA